MLRLRLGLGLRLGLRLGLGVKLGLKVSPALRAGPAREYTWEKYCRCIVVYCSLAVGYSLVSSIL